MLNCMKFYAIVFFHFALDGQKTELIYRCIDSQALGRQNSILTSYIKIYADDFGGDVISADSPKIEGNGPLRIGGIRRNPATIALAKFFTYVIAVSIGFQRVAVPPIGSVRKAAVDGRRLCIFWIFFFQMFSPDGADSPFQTYRTHTHTHTDEKVN